MKNLRFIAIMALALALPLLAQEELLPDGAYGTTIHGGITAGEKKAYILDGLQGQVLKAHVLTKEVDKGATLDLLDSDGDSLLGDLPRLTKVDAVNLVLPKKDRYELHVTAGKSTCQYVLEVTLEDAPEPPRKKPQKPLRPSSSPSPRGERPSGGDL